MSVFSNLNDMQKLAVKTTESPVLILAGAGSGKTTVLVNRLSYIMSEMNVNPYRILAITFTNKAALEMKTRIKTRIGEVAENMWIGTFHSMCVRILRADIELLGYDRDFVIYDTTDSKALIKECMKELDLSEKTYPIRSLMSTISRAKDDVMTPETFAKVYENDYRMTVISKVYSLYQQKIKKNNALDFDDLIIKTIQLLTENEKIREKYQEKFKYIMVDEYQDTNNAQYLLISLLAGKYRNLCVVGDDDQSIYKFRGANIYNILDFEAEFPDAVTIKLEQNYRSTSNILNAANAVIANNKERKGKNLWTEKGKGEKITIFNAPNEHEEGDYICRCVEEHVKNGGQYSDCAVLYRINAQSRVIEEMLMRKNIPYRVLAGLRFYDRKEIKDIIAYLRVIYNFGDDVSLKRIINEPKRGIGQTTVDKAQAIADSKGIPLYKVFNDVEEYPELKRASGNIKEFTKIINELSNLKDTLSITDLVIRTLNDTGYSVMVKASDDKDSKSRAENLDELVSVVKEYEMSPEEQPSLSNFLERVALVSDVDNYDEEQNSVILMTIHSAKGLEFPIVFLPGMEDGLFPGSVSIGDASEMEEERRLCYVAITRAKEKLHIIHSVQRMIFGKTVSQPRSTFVKEIPSSYYTEKTPFSSRATSVLGMLGFERSAPKTPDWRNTTINRQGTRFKAGDRVNHNKFGEGRVISAQPFGDDYKVEVLFDNFGKKILMSNFAKLEKISE